MPHLLQQFHLRLRSIFRRDLVDHELDDELQFHLSRLIDQEIARGLPPQEARYSALRLMGPIAQNQEVCRDMRQVNWIEDLQQDLRYTVRTLCRNPIFSIVAVVALALGIGVNTAMYSVAYGMLFRPLPYAEPDRVAVVYMNYSPRDFRFGTMCMRDYLLWKDNNHVFENPSIFRNQSMDIGGSEGLPEQVDGAAVTAGFFSTIGATPLIGRGFVPGDDKPTADKIAVLSETLWRRRYGSDPAVLGRTITVNGGPVTVIGVMPAAVKFPRTSVEVWTNLPLVPPTRYGPWFYRGVARLKPGIGMPQAQAELATIANLMMQENPYYKRLEFPVLMLRDALVGTSMKSALLALTGAVGLVLLIAVVNVANLMLARAAVRRREIAVRLSLGAGRGRLVRQLLTESVLLAGLGGLAGLGVAWWCIRLIRVWNPGNFPMIQFIQLDGGAVAFMAAVSVLAGIMFGLAPALQGARTDLSQTLRESGSASGASSGSRSVRAVLVVSEIAISLMLLVGAGLLLRSFANLHRVTAGFTKPPRQMLSMLISPSKEKSQDVRTGLAFDNELLRRARGIPGVESAALTDSIPPNQQGDADTFVLDGQELGPGEMNPVITLGTVTPEFFSTMGIPLVRGRYFDDHDLPDSAPVALVSEAFARRYFPGQDAVGKRIKQSGPGFGDNWMQIVGVVGNVKYMGLTMDTAMAYYMPLAQSYSPRIYLVVSTSGDASLVAERLRAEIQSLDPTLTLAQVETIEQSMDQSVSRPRFNAMLLGLFAGIALVLAAVGIYGLVAYWVAQRTREIGVRMALGAGPADVIRMVAGQGAMLAGFGIGIGLAGALALTRVLQALLFGVSVRDVATFALAPLGMILVVLLATLIPAIRATRVSPVAALRCE